MSPTHAAQFLRTWAVTRYPGFRYHDHMARNLDVTPQRPTYDNAVESYTASMTPVVDQIVARAKVHAKRVPPLRSASEGTRAVVYALRENRKPAPDMRYARR